MSLLLRQLRSFFCGDKALQVGDRLVVAFSGGPDSTALLWGLKQLSQEWKTDLFAAHLDHGLDEGSGERARRAGLLADQIGVPFRSESLDRDLSQDGLSLEAYARRCRYGFLERAAEDLGARFVATAHHADDQAETVLLRFLYGSGLPGLAGIQPRRGLLVRPLLGLRRRDIEKALRETQLEPLIDPTNFDLRQPRSRVRQALLPRLEEDAEDLVPRLCALADRAHRARHRIDDTLASYLDLRSTLRGATIDRNAFESFGMELRRHTLSMLARAADAPYPPTAEARKELNNQLSRGGRVGCDCGHGFRLVGDGRSLRLVRNEPLVGHFTYTLQVPGAIEIPELGQTVCLAPAQVAEWMTRGQPDKTGLFCPDLGERHVTVRNRRPGDRIRPLGSAKNRRLKEMLINRQVPQEDRDRIPLLVIDEEIAWVPGVTLAESFRLPEEARDVWVATLSAPERLPRTIRHRSGGDSRER